MPMKVSFVDLPARLAPYRQAFHAALDRVLDHGQVILGPEVAAFEAAVADYASCRHAIAVANGTDALVLALKAKGIGAGDEVITTPMSYLASTSSIVLAGAKPVFADVGEDLNLDPAAVERVITPRTKAIQLVHLAGIPADMQRFTRIAQQHGLVLIEDCAQGFGATYAGRMVGTFGTIGAVSLHPLKNLGTPGDAGIILTDDDQVADWLVVARNHGHSSRDECEFWSLNSRLDALHAAFLKEMLADLPRYLELRRRQADRYRRRLDGVVGFPAPSQAARPTFNMFMILTRQRDALQQYLEAHGVETRIHYPLPIHKLKAAQGIRGAEALPRAERYSAEILSLPLGMHLADQHIDYTTDRIIDFFNKAG